MADNEVEGVASSPAAISTIKKEKKTKNPRSKPSHPPTSDMVNNAIKGLKERRGSSLQAIKKYIAANYKVDAEKVSPLIKTYLKSAVIAGTLVQTKVKGASGSFRLSATGSGVAKQTTAEKKKKSSTVSTTGKAKRSQVKSTAPAKTATAAKEKVVKKSPAAKGRKAVASVEKKTTKKNTVVSSAAENKALKSPAVATTTSTSKSKSPSKAKKSNKPGPTKKPKAPKPKTAKSPSTTKAKKQATPKKKK